MLHTYAPSELMLWIVGNKQDLLTTTSLHKSDFYKSPTKDALDIEVTDVEVMLRLKKVEEELKRYRGRFRYVEVSAKTGFGV